MSQLSELLKIQDRVVGRAQLLSMGVTDAFIRHRLQTMRWFSLAPGVYLCGAGRPSEQQRARAAVLASGPNSMVSGVAGMRLHGVRVDPDPQVVTLVSSTTRRASNPLYRSVRCQELPSPSTVAGIPVAPLSRATLDACRGIASLDEIRKRLAAPVQQRQCRAIDLLATARSGGRFGSAVRSGLLEIADGVRSVPEAKVRQLILKSGLPAPLWNPTLYTRDGELIAIPDAYWADAGVAIEVESKEFHFEVAAWERTMARRTRMSSCGILVVQAPPSRIRVDSEGFLAETARTYDIGLARPRLDIVIRPAS